MKKNEHPVNKSRSEVFYADDSDQEVPNLQVGAFEYADKSIIELEVRSLYTPQEEESIILLGTKGYELLAEVALRPLLKNRLKKLTKSDE